jgi:3-phenylpropionate/cinnamic acid dioxygenase small subunit
VDDVAAILDTYSRYAQAMADRRFDDWAAQFTADASFVNNLGTFRGREQLQDMITKRFDGDTTSRVMWCNPVIEVEGDRAHSKTDYLLLAASADPGSGLVVRTMGRYDDVLRKEGGRWLIHERRAAST